MNKKLLFFVIAATAAISGCSESKKEEVKESTPSKGEMIVKANCKVCHAQGLNGAPILGNKKMWEERKQKGIDQLTQNAINGFGLMPAKGGKTELTDEEINLAVGFMLEQVTN